ncbi:MAG: LexA family transcriptional regulator [Bacillota bacterium]|nr:LexA family transcriptional regulator [Bacillota bacterium]MDW7677901.1 LexA family transcriptional regulator [Bacillota bacterium]
MIDGINRKQGQVKEGLVDELKEHLGKELKRSRKAAGFTQGDVAKRLKINSKTLSSYETGRSKPAIDFLIDAAALYGLDPSAFLSFAQNYAKPVKNALKIPVLSARKTYKDRSEFFMANDPISYGYADVERPEDYVFISVPDDTMRDHRIQEDDYVLIRKAQTPKDGDIVAALVGGYPTIRKYEKLTEDSFLLKPGDLSGSRALVVKNNKAEGLDVELLGVKRLIMIF